MKGPKLGSFKRNTRYSNAMSVAEKAIAKSKRVLERDQQIRDTCKRLIELPPKLLEEKLAQYNASNPAPASDGPMTVEDLRKIANGEFDNLLDKRNELTRQIEELTQDIEDTKRHFEELEASKPVETAVPIRAGHYDYRMLVDEANDAKHTIMSATFRRFSAESNSDWLDGAIGNIPGTDTFVWSPDIMKIVMGTAVRVPPDFRMFPERLITLTPQWWWWGEIGNRLNLKSLGLPMLGILVNRAVNKITGSDGVIVSPIVRDGGSIIATPGFAWSMNDDLASTTSTWLTIWKDSGKITEDDLPENEISIIKLFAAAVSWMTQKVTVISPYQVGRGTRKRADANKIVHTTSVIQLRRTESVRHEGESREVEWSHRWMVSEHYRNQYYRSTGKHERILITAFVKGPADKPLILKDKVYVVNR